MENPQKDKLQAAIITTVLHVTILLILWFSVLREHEELGSGSGALVQVGLIDNATGIFESSGEEPTPPKALQAPTQEEELITQNNEETIHLKEQKKEEQKKQEAEQQKKEQIANQIKNAFGKGASQNNSRGQSNSGNGIEGSQQGNASTGAKSGVGGNGGYNLGGRGLAGSLPYPSYDNSNDAGTIVISITVDPQGNVIDARFSLNGSSGTAASNPTLRTSAIAAARKAKFERSKGNSNQTGTIFYHFKQN